MNEWMRETEKRRKVEERQRKERKKKQKEKTKERIRKKKWQLVKEIERKKLTQRFDQKGRQQRDRYTQTCTITFTSIHYIYIYIYIYICNQYHPQVKLLAWISLTLTRHSSLSSITSDKSSKRHSVSVQSCLNFHSNSLSLYIYIYIFFFFLSTYLLLIF